MESRHQLGLDSYDRFFPNQDTMQQCDLKELIEQAIVDACREEEQAGGFIILDEA
jgi:hypothetical protein